MNPCRFSFVAVSFVEEIGCDPLYISFLKEVLQGSKQIKNACSLACGNPNTAHGGNYFESRLTVRDLGRQDYR